MPTDGFCPLCREPIRRAMTPDGFFLTLDPDPAPDGEVWIVTHQESGLVVEIGEPPPAELFRYAIHAHSQRPD